jgi:hypothetical protein
VPDKIAVYVENIHLPETRAGPSPLDTAIYTTTRTATGSSTPKFPKPQLE